MRISDWSSDVCSSDLGESIRRPATQHCGDIRRPCIGRQIRQQAGPRHGARIEPTFVDLHAPDITVEQIVEAGRDAGQRIFESLIGHARFAHDQIRSEEHTSELQSLMRISYAVLCLKKIKINYT